MSSTTISISARRATCFKQAGYTMSGKNLTKDGQQLTLKLLYGPATSKMREGIATVMQQQLGDLGIKVDVQPLEFQAYLNTLQTDPFDYDLFVLGWSATIEPHFIVSDLGGEHHPAIEQRRVREQAGRDARSIRDRRSSTATSARRSYGDIQRTYHGRRAVYLPV